MWSFDHVSKPAGQLNEPRHLDITGGEERKGKRLRYNINRVMRLYCGPLIATLMVVKKLLSKCSPNGVGSATVS